MKTKPIILIFLTFLFLFLLAIPVQAASKPFSNGPQNGADLGRGPTNTKKPKKTQPPRRTATPRPANTGTRAAGTNLATLASTQVAGSPISTLNGSPLASPTANPLFSPTATLRGMSTIVAQQTGTANASYLTSTAVAGLYSPTPTNLGAESITPLASLDATSLALTGTSTPTSEFYETKIATPTVMSSPTAILIPVDGGQQGEPQGNQPAAIWFLLGGVGVLTLLILFYLLYREWKKTTVSTT